MALRHLALEQIDEAELQRLVEGRAPETQEIEYKRQLYGNSDRDCGEYLADISSFANTVGGDIVIGMAAEAGVPTEFEPIQIDPDPEILRLENIARSGLQPRIFGLAIRAVRINGGGVILIMRIPRSYNQPHRIIRQGPGHHRFYARSSAGKYEPSVDELRVLFNRAPELASRLRDFRFDRIAKIAANEIPVRLASPHALILHVIPLSAFNSRRQLPLGPRDNLYIAFPPIGSLYASDFRINVDGLLTVSGAPGPEKPWRGYLQLFHSGIVETVNSSMLRGAGTPESPFLLTALWTEAAIVKYSHIYLSSLGSIGFAPPFVVLVSLIGVKSVLYSFATSGLFEDEAGVLDRDQIHFSEIVIDEVPDDRYEFAKQLRPLLNETANAAGRSATPSFDQSGKFTFKVD